MRKLTSAVLYAILLTVIIGFLSHVFNDTFENTAIYFLIGVVSAILAGLHPKGDE